eukprot:357066-Chlamydomonas_euryale.AAC.11
MQWLRSKDTCDRLWTYLWQASGSDCKCWSAVQRSRAKGRTLCAAMCTTRSPAIGHGNMQGQHVSLQVTICLHSPWLECAFTSQILTVAECEAEGGMSVTYATISPANHPGNAAQVKRSAAAICTRHVLNGQLPT